ncbi:YccF domain-containing protein [Dechloromonas sp. A34]
MGLGWWLVGLVCFQTIVGIPWGKACFVIGQFSFSRLVRRPSPFGVNIL